MKATELCKSYSSPCHIIIVVSQETENALTSSQNRIITAYNGQL